ncbi:MAG: glycosyltransferase family protein [Rickettsiales bacterium]
MDNPVVIVQARMGSTRLSGKIMKKLCGKTVLAHDIARISQAGRVGAIVVATTDKPSDDAVSDEAKKCGARVFRGSEDDVLSRYYFAAKEAGARTVVRVTSDCPLYDGLLLDAMLETFSGAGCDYLSNGIERTFPRGLDTEIFTFDALEEAHFEARRPEEREHVTPFIYRNPQKFSLYSYTGAPNNAHMRWTLDTEEDFSFIFAVYDALYREGAIFSTDDVFRLLRNRPELAELNAHVEQKAH